MSAELTEAVTGWTIGAGAAFAVYSSILLFTLMYNRHKKEKKVRDRKKGKHHLYSGETYPRISLYAPNSPILCHFIEKK